MNFFFAATGLLVGVVGGGVAFFMQLPAPPVAVLTGGQSTQPQPMLSLVAANKYQLYLFVSEFLRRSSLTQPLDRDTVLSDYEFYRIVYKLVKPMAEKKNASGHLAT